MIILVLHEQESEKSVAFADVDNASSHGQPLGKEGKGREAGRTSMDGRTMKRTRTIALSSSSSAEPCTTDPHLASCCRILELYILVAALRGAMLVAALVMQKMCQSHVVPKQMHS